MSTSPVCVDASFVVRLFMGPNDAEAWGRLEEWLANGQSVHAPSLLPFEVANALHRYHRAGFLSAASAQLALDASLALPIGLESSASLHRTALRLAADLGLPATYDSHYLALAAQLNAELWTADARLATCVGRRGPTVRVIGRRVEAPALTE